MSFNKKLNGMWKMTNNANLFINNGTNYCQEKKIKAKSAKNIKHKRLSVQISLI